MGIHHLRLVRGESEHEIRFEHHPLTDAGRVFVDGVETNCKLMRRAFSGLFRYRFELGGEALEVRVSPSGMRGLAVELARAASEPPAPNISWGMVWAASGGSGALVALISWLALGGSPPAHLVVGAFASVASALILGSVYTSAR